MYEVQAIEAHGMMCAEYRYEPEIPDDPEPEFALVCGSCDFYLESKGDATVGKCALTLDQRRSCSLACPKVKVTSPF